MESQSELIPNLPKEKMLSMKRGRGLGPDDVLPRTLLQITDRPHEMMQRRRMARELGVGIREKLNVSSPDQYRALQIPAISQIIHDWATSEFNNDPKALSLWFAWYRNGAERISNGPERNARNYAKARRELRRISREMVNKNSGYDEAMSAADDVRKGLMGIGTANLIMGIKKS